MKGVASALNATKRLRKSWITRPISSISSSLSEWLNLCPRSNSAIINVSSSPTLWNTSFLSLKATKSLQLCSINKDLPLWPNNFLKAMMRNKFWRKTRPYHFSNQSMNYSTHSKISRIWLYFMKLQATKLNRKSSQKVSGQIMRPLNQEVPLSMLTMTEVSNSH